MREVMGCRIQVLRLYRGLSVEGLGLLRDFLDSRIWGLGLRRVGCFGILRAWLPGIYERF